MRVGYTKNVNRKRGVLSGAYTTDAHINRESLDMAAQSESESCMREVQAKVASLQLNINLS